MVLTENKILKEIYKVLNENRKVIKVGNSQPPMSPMPMEDPTMMAGAVGPMGGGPETMNPSMDTNSQMPDGGTSNQFDTNFDAGVEADEETDPKRYIQQLTGKLSQSLNSFNNEQGPDAGLSKYVASMIIAAACKNLDEKAKKELIEKINSASSDTDDEMPDTEEVPDEEPQEASDMNGGEQQPMMERVFKKRDLYEMAFGKPLTKRQLRESLPNGVEDEERPKEVKRQNTRIPDSWKPKKFNS